MAQVSACLLYTSIPLGNALGSKLFSGMGPELKVGVLPMGEVSAEYFTEFYAAGINQTRYKIYIVLKSDMALVVGLSLIHIYKMAFASPL